MAITFLPSTSGTLQVEVLTPGQDADAGVDQLTGTLSLGGTADTPVHGVTIRQPTLIKPGQRVGIVIAGTMTNLVGGNVTIMLEIMNRGQQ